MDVPQPSKHNFLGYLEINFGTLFHVEELWNLMWFTQNMDEFETRLWSNWNCLWFQMNVNNFLCHSTLWMRFANDEANIETKHICYGRWQLSWHCDNYLILCLTKQTRKSQVCQPIVILCWYHLENLGLHNKTKDINRKPCINVVWTQGKPFKFYKSIIQNQGNLTFKKVFMCNLSFMSFYFGLITTSNISLNCTGWL
jgi:hypothetical protein